MSLIGYATLSLPFAWPSRPLRFSLSPTYYLTFPRLATCFWQVSEQNQLCVVELVLAMLGVCFENGYIASAQELNTLLRVCLNHFIDHIVHQILTLYALGASPETLQKQYNNNTAYQRPPVPINDAVIQDLEDPSKFSKYLGDETHYRDYLSFFKSLLDQHGYEKVLNDYLFKGDELAEDMLTRLANGTSVAIKC